LNNKVKKENVNKNDFYKNVSTEKLNNFSIICLK
jgi:hypothetical protein